MFSKIRSLLGGASKNDPRALFAEEVAHYIAALPNIKSVAPGEKPFSLEVEYVDYGEDRGDEHGKHLVFLENAFLETREISPEERRERFHVYFGEIGQLLDKSWAGTKGALAPVIRPSGWGTEWAQEKKEHALFQRPFLPFLSMFAVVDRANSMAYVNKKSIASWGVTEDALLEALLARFSVLEDPAIDRYDDTHGPLFIVATNDTYETSRLLLPGFLASFRGKIEGNPIAIMPERATLMIGGDARPEMIARLVEHAEREYNASNRALSPALYTVDERGTVVPFHAPAHVDPELAQKIELAHYGLASVEYGNQKRALDERFAANGTDVFVASYQIFEKDGRLVSRSVWTRGADSLLPETDQIALVVLAENREVPADVVLVPREAIADRLKKSDDYAPTRFSTIAFPSDAELAQLRAKYT